MHKGTQKHHISVKILKAFFLFVLFGCLRNVQADVQNVTVSVDVNNSITVNLSNSILYITNPVVTISTQPVNGTATAVACLDTSLRCVSYTPDTDFTGIDTFDYQVTNNASNIEQATISIKVGNPSQTSQGQLPENAVDETLSEICLNNEGGELVDLCESFNQATNSGVPEDLRELLNALSPQDVAAFGTIANDLATQQLINIGKRLAAMRRGRKGFSIGGLSFSHNGYRLPGSIVDRYLFNQTSTGGVSVDNINNPFSLFISGDIGGGTQQASDFEDGFNFLSLGITTGVDYRLSNRGIIGSALGYANSSTNIESVGGGLDVAGFSVIFYGSIFPINKLSVDAIFMQNFYSFSSQRRIIFGETDATAKSDTTSSSLASSLSATYEVITKKGLTGSIVGKLEYINTKIDGFAEHGADPFNVVIEDENFNQVTSLLGLQSTYAISLKWGVIVPQLDLSWIANFEKESDPIQGYFAADPDKTPFSFDTNAPDNNYFRLSMGVSAVFVNRGSGFFQYSTTLAKDYLTDWHLSGGWRFEF